MEVVVVEVMGDVVHPNLQDIEASYEGRAGGGCLPYGRRTAEKQPWLQGNMCRCLNLTLTLTILSN